MRAMSSTRWATCALAITVSASSLLFASAPARADRTRSISSCTSFQQTNKDDDKVAFTIHNACSLPVDCELSWRVVCAPQSKKRRAEHPSMAKLALTEGGSDSAEASAAVCGDDGWTIDQVQWSCKPNNE